MSLEEFIDILEENNWSSNSVVDHWYIFRNVYSRFCLFSPLWCRMSHLPTNHKSVLDNNSTVLPHSEWYVVCISALSSQDWDFSVLFFLFFSYPPLLKSSQPVRYATLHNIRDIKYLCPNVNVQISKFEIFISNHNTLKPSTEVILLLSHISPFNRTKIKCSCTLTWRKKKQPKPDTVNYSSWASSKKNRRLRKKKTKKKK